MNMKNNHSINNNINNNSSNNNNSKYNHDVTGHVIKRCVMIQLTETTRAHTYAHTQVRA